MERKSNPIAMKKAKIAESIATSRASQVLDPESAAPTDAQWRDSFNLHQAGEPLDPVQSDLLEHQKSLAEIEERRRTTGLGRSGLGRIFRRP